MESVTENNSYSLEEIRGASKTQLTDLPPEILIQILARLPTEDILKNVSQVSKYLNQLSKDSSIRLTVKFGPKTSSHSVEKFLSQRAQQIENLKLHFLCSDAQESVSKKIKLMSKLTTIDICDVKEDKYQLVKNSFQVSGLKVFQVYCPLGESSLDVVGQCEQLKKLTVYNLTGLGISKEQFTGVLSLRHMTELCIETLMFIPEHFTFPASSISKVMKLEMTINNFSPFHLEMIAACFPKLVKIVINGRNNKFDSESKTFALASMFKKCKNICSFFFNCQPVQQSLLKSDFLQAFNASYFRVQCTGLMIHKKLDCTCSL